MEKPYQKDLTFLQEELTHHEYIAKKFHQECDIPHAKQFDALCDEIRAAICTVKARQETALSEWASLNQPDRHEVLRPLEDGLMRAAAAAKTLGCPEFAVYLEQLLSGYLCDLSDFSG